MSGLTDAALGFSRRHFQNLTGTLRQNGVRMVISTLKDHRVSRFFRTRQRGQYDARAVANWFIRRSARDNEQDDKTQLQLLKLVFFAHGWMLGINGQPLISQTIRAWRHGPVVRELYDAIKHNGSRPVIELIEGHEDAQFDDNAESILEQVFQEYGPLHGFELSDITHRPGSPWFETRMRRLGSAIPDDLMQEFFSQDQVDA